MTVKPCCGVRYTVWLVAAVVVSALATGTLLDTVPSLYHQQRGRMLLARALLVEGREIVGSNGLLSLESLVDTESRALARDASAELQVARDVNPANAHAQRGLGQVNLFLDKPTEALTAFSKYVELRPDDPLGWWELGLAYERLSQQLPEGVYWALASPDPHVPADLGNTITQSDIVTTSPAMAHVETPGFTMDTPSCTRGELHQACLIALAGWDLPTAPLDIDLPETNWWAPAESSRRAALFMHPPSRATFSMTLPMTPTALVFWMGIDPAAWTRVSDGVAYRVRANGTTVFSYTLTKAADRQGWHPASVDLTGWRGEQLQVTFETGPVSPGDWHGDWAGWGDVLLVRKNEVASVLAEPAWRAVAAWRQGGFTFQDLIDAGDEARKAKQQKEALTWYERAAQIEPELADPWYYIGLACEGAERWDEALKAYRTAVSDQVRVLRVPRGSIYYRIGTILQWHTDPRPVDDVIGAYDLALADGRFVSAVEEADVHYNRGVIYWWRRSAGEPERYMVAFETALQLDPQHAWAALLLGRAYFLDFDDLVQARSYTERSIELHPDNAWAYLYLGDILVAEGKTEQAKVQYGKALALTPGFSEAQERLQGLAGEP